MINIKSALLGGGSAVVMPGFDAEAVIEAIETHGVTYLTGVPAIYRLLLRSDALDTHDVSSVRAGGCGSDAVPERLYDDFEAAFGAPLLEGYGLTEGGPMVTTSPRWGVRRRGSAGLALPGVDTRVVDPETREQLPPDEVGELVVASPGVAEFHDRPDLDSRFEERDGKRFLLTGDLVRKDQDGFHFVVGRTDDMFVVGGENLYPVDVEDLLERHESVADAAVVAVPHEVKGKAPVAFVVAADAVTETELQEFAAERGPRYAVPRRVLFWESLPLTSTEKVDRDALEREAREAVGGTLGEE
jgi:acyl-CoA synthetase (AMP-forming)/AMP-acid ligase II